MELTDELPTSYYDCRLVPSPPPRARSTCFGTCFCSTGEWNKSTCENTWIAREEADWVVEQKARAKTRGERTRRTGYESITIALCNLMQLDLIAFPPLNSFVLAVRPDASPLAPPPLTPYTCHVR